MNCINYLDADDFRLKLTNSQTNNKTGFSLADARHSKHQGFESFQDSLPTYERSDGVR